MSIGPIKRINSKWINGKEESEFVQYNAYPSLGSILVGGLSGTSSFVSSGVDGEVLTSDSSYPNGVKWSSVSGATPQHNDLDGLQGGTSTERYHITLSDVSNIHPQSSDNQDLWKTITGDSGSSSASSQTDSLSIVGGESINTSVSGDVLTINSDYATTSSKGIAQFSPSFFSVSSGTTSLLGNIPNSFESDSGTAMPSSNTIKVYGSNGLATSGSSDEVVISGLDSSTSSKGVSQFNSDDFTVSSGLVSIRISNGNTLTNLSSGSIPFIKSDNTISSSTNLSWDNSLSVLKSNSIIAGSGSTSAGKVTIEGVLGLQETSTPSNTSNFGKLYTSTSNSSLYYLDSSDNNYTIIKKVIVKSSNYNVTSSDDTIVVNASGGNVDINLISSINGKQYTIKKNDPSGNVVNINANGKQKINGSPTLTITSRHECYTLLGSGSGWHIISQV